MNQQRLIRLRSWPVLIAAALGHLTGCTGCGRPQLESVLDVSFTRPTNGKQLGVADKSDPSAPGFPVDVEVQGQDSAGREITLFDAKLEIRSSPTDDWAPGPDPQLNGARAVFPATPLVTGSNMLRTTITEKGSLRTAIRTIEVLVPNATGCAVAFTFPATTPFTFNQSHDEDPSTPGLQTTLRGVTPTCRGAPVSLYKGNVGGSPLATTTADAMNGSFSFYITLQDGEQTRLIAQMADPFPPNPISSAFVDVTVKIKAPAITNPSPPIPSPLNTLFYVADSNIYLLQLSPGQPDAGYIQNKGPDVDAVADFSFTVANAKGGTARLVYRGLDVAPPISIDSDPQNISWTSAHLPQQSSGALQFMATDSAGNQTILSANTTVDVIPPSPSSFTAVNLAPDGGRTATVNLTWTASGDDGNAGTPAGYDIRWSTKVVIPSGVPTDGGYFDPNQFTRSPGGIVNGSMTSTQATPLPPLNTYLFQVRPFDPIGNYARQSPQSSLDNFLPSRNVLNPDAGTTGFGLHVAAADFDGDGRDDLAVGAATSNPGTVYVYSGTADLSTFGTAPSRTLTPPDGQSGFFGLDFSVGHVNDDPLPRADLLVSQNGWSCNGMQPISRGRAFLYMRNFANVVEFRGTGPTTSFGASSRIIPDINGDGFDEVLFSAHREDTNVGRVYLFYGRTLSAWQALATQTDPTTCVASAGPYIPTSAADRVFFGDGTPGTDAQCFAGSLGDCFFGRLRGYTTIDNRALGAGVLFTIPASLENTHRVFILPSNTAGGPIATAQLQTLNYGPDAPPPFSIIGFGAEAFGKLNLIRGPAKDLVVTQPKQSNVYVFPDATANGFNITNAPPLIINSPLGANFGASLAVGDINGDGRPDILVGENVMSGLSAWIFYNQPILNQEFDSRAGSGFAQSRLSSTTSLGLGLTVGDFNGDGKPDIAAGDASNGTGRVTVWY